MTRKRTVSNAAWLGIGAALLVMAAGTTYYFLRSRETLPIGACPPGEHVGAKGFSWPHPELFLDEFGFGAALEAFGYDVGDWLSEQWRVCSDPVRRAVREFQEDYNFVRPVLEDPPMNELLPTGLIDEATVRAMAYVDGLQTEVAWPKLVYEVRSGLSGD